MVMRRVLALVMALWSMTAGAAQFTASVDRSELYQDEFLVLTLSLVNSETRLRAEGVKPNIDLTLLTDQFDVGTPRADFRFNVNRHQGRSTSDIVVELFPKRAGTLAIPPFDVDGLRTARIPVRVLPRATDKAPEVFVRSQVGKQSIWQREQLVVYTDLYHRVELASAKTGGQVETEPPDPNVRLLPKSERAEVVDGIEYRVVRNGWAMFPAHSGTLKVFVPDVWIETAQQHKQRFPVEAINVDVKPLPADVPATSVIGKPDITVAPLSGEYTVGRMASWNITVRAPVMDVALPPDLPPLDAPAELKAYASKANRTLEDGAAGVTGIATYTLALIPTRPGALALPPIRFPYFDTQRGMPDVAVIDGPIIEVNADSSIPSTNADSAPSVNSTAGAASSTGALRAWQTAAVIFGALWLSAMIVLLRRRALPPANPAVAISSPRRARFAARPLIQELLDALDAPTLEAGLAAWEQRHGTDEELREVIRALQNYYYGKQRSGVEGALRAAVTDAATRIRATATITASPNAWAPESFISRV